MGELKYEPVKPLGRKELTLNLRSEDPKIVADALYSASRFETDTTWVEDECITRLFSPEIAVRWAAATCLGDLALFRRPLNLDKVIPALEEALKDQTIQEPAEFSLRMVKEFCLPTA
jgi:hypothetical protein